MSDSRSEADQGLATQHERLASLETCEERLRDLRERECDREVEHMAAEAAFHGATNRLHPNVEREAAARIGELLETRRVLDERLRATDAGGGPRGAGSGRSVDQLRAGHAALHAWLEAGASEKPSSAARLAKVVLLLASVAILWAAFAVHLAFLLLLVAVVGPVSFAMARGQDEEWRRVGARRRYDASGLADFGEWNEPSVRARAEELEALIDAAPGGAPHPAREAVDEAPDDGASLAARIADLDRRVAAELAGAGLTPADSDGEVGEWLRLAARAEGSRRTLEQVKEERRRVRDEAVELREQLGRYLQSRGIKPTAHQDTSADIAERLEDLERSGRADR